MTTAFTDHAAHVEEMQPVARFDGRRHVADESFQCPPFSEDAHKDIATADPGQASRREFKVPISHRLAESPNGYNVAGTWFLDAVDDRKGNAQPKRRGGRTYLVSSNNHYLFLATLSKAKSS